MSAYPPSTARCPHDATKHAKYDPPHNKTRIVSRRISRNTNRAQPLSCPQRTLRKVLAIPILVPQMRRTQRFSVVFWCLWRGIPRRVAIVPCPTGCVRLSAKLRLVIIECKRNISILNHVTAGVCAKRIRRTPVGFACYVASFKKRARHFLCPARFLVTHRGFEPRTIALKVRCSTG